MAWFIHLLKDAAPYSWIVVGLAIVGLVGLVVLGVLLHRRLSRPSWTTWVAPLVVVVAGFGALGLLVGKLDRSVLNGSETLGMQALLFAEGRSRAFGAAATGTLFGTMLLSLSGVVVASRALRQGHREIGGRAMTAGALALLLAIGAFFARRLVLAKMGGGASLVSLPAVLVLAASVIAALTIFCAAASVPEWADKDDERAAAGDVATALSLALASVFLATVTGQLFHWRTTLAAAAGAHVDAVERGGILQSGNDEARALVYAAVLALVPLVVAIAAALLPRARVVGPAVLRAAPAITAALIATLLSAITTNVTAQRSIARVREIDELPWPKDVEAAIVDARTSGLDPVLGAPMFAKNNRVWFEGMLRMGSLADLRTCSGMVGQAPVARIQDRPLAIGVDRSTPIAAMHCLALATAERRWALLAPGAKSTNDEVAWLVRIKVERGRGVTDQYTSTTRAMGATSQSELSAAEARVHITRTGWEIQRRGAPVERGEGNAIPVVPLPDRALVLLTASPDVTAERFLVALGALPLQWQLLLGPPVLGLEDDEATPAPLHALPRAGFGSEVIWQSSTALSQPDADALESAVQAAVAQCANAGGASSLALAISVAKTGEATIIPTPADTRGSCFANVLGTLRLPPREAVATANILVDELHLAHLPASALKKPVPPKKQPHPPPKPPPKPPRKKQSPGAPCVQCQ